MSGPQGSDPTQPWPGQQPEPGQDQPSSEPSANQPWQPPTPAADQPTNAAPTFASTKIMMVGIYAFRGGGGETLSTDLGYKYDHFFIAW